MARAFEERNSSMPGFYQPDEEEYDPKIDDFVVREMARERNYRHFDLPLSERQRNREFGFETEDRTHRFLPLLGFTDLTRKYVRYVDANGKWARDGNGEFAKKEKIKERPIRYAGHEDSAYLQAYAAHLSCYYEAALVADGTAGSVLAYRKGGGTNIHHARSLFDEIRERGDCSVFAMDISGFFDCLDHLLLRNEIADLLRCSRLEGHHATVWKNVTRYSWVETDDLDTILGRKRSRRGRICSPEDFRNYVRGRKEGLVRKHDLPFGIPQGTPVSGLYANLYLRTFDRELLSLFRRMGGSYRRYSDDIAVVLPYGAKLRHVVGVIEKFLADRRLAMSVEKTDAARFKAGIAENPGGIQYLGFTFDGLQTLIRPSSMDAYRAKMRRGIHAKLVAAKMKGVPSTHVHKREAMSRYTHRGKRRNFLRYAYLASDVLQAPEIRAQVKSHVTWFNRAWDHEIENVYGGLVTAP